MYFRRALYPYFDSCRTFVTSTYETQEEHLKDRDVK